MAPSPDKPEMSAQEEEIQRLMDHIRQTFTQLYEQNNGRKCNELETAALEIPFNVLALVKDRTDLLNTLRGFNWCLSGRALTPAMKENIVVAAANFVEQEPLLQAFMNLPLEDTPDFPLQSMYVAVQTKWLAQRASKKPVDRGGKGDSSARSGGCGGGGAGRKRRSDPAGSSRSGGSSTGRRRRSSPRTETRRNRRSSGSSSGRSRTSSRTGTTTRTRRSSSQSSSSRRRNRRSGGDSSSRSSKNRR